MSVPLSLSGDLSVRVGRRLRALQARARHRLGVPLRDPGSVRVNGQFRHPIDTTRRSALIACYRERFPHAIDVEREEAARLMAHYVSLLGHPRQHGDRIAWTVDPASGRPWSADFSPDIPYRGDGRLGDIKLPWELNKHQYFFTLGKTSWLTGNAEFADEIIRQIDDWIATNPYQTGINWISALETGTRIVSWVLAYPFYAERADAAFMQRLTASLARHASFVESGLSTGRFANTHLVGEAAALVVAGLFLDCRHSERWLTKGLEILEEQIERQSTADGMHAELSVAYHRFFLDNYYLVAGLLAANGRSFSNATLATMEQLTAFLMHVLFPDGSAPNFGDNDDARALWFRSDAPWDYRSVLGLGAVMFNRGDFKSTAPEVSEEILWLFGPKGIDAFDALTARAPETRAAGFRDAGYFVMRGGWEPADPVLVADCGALGFGPGGHGHADALSFQLFASGYPFLVDAGTFSYNIDYTWRDVFRGTRSHNTVVVDGVDQSVPRDRMSWTMAAKATVHNWITASWFDLLDGSHDGYTRLSDPVSHRRALIFLKPDVWIVWDRLDSGGGEHTVDLMLHVRPDCALTADPADRSALLTAPGGQQLRLWMAGEAGAEASVSVVSGDVDELGAWFSPSYGVRVPSSALKLRKTFAGPCNLVTCASTSTDSCRLAMPTANTVSVSLGDNTAEARTLIHLGGRGDLAIDGFRFDGAVLLYRAQPDGLSSVWASDFLELSLDGLLEVRSPMPIENLVLADNRCDVVLNPEFSSGVQCAVAEGVAVTINGQPHQSAPVRNRGRNEL